MAKRNTNSSSFKSTTSRRHVKTENGYVEAVSFLKSKEPDPKHWAFRLSSGKNGSWSMLELSYDDANTIISFFFPEPSFDIEEELGSKLVGNLLVDRKIYLKLGYGSKPGRCYFKK